MRDLEILGRKFREAVEGESLVRIEDAARVSVARGHLVAAHENLQSMEAEAELCKSAHEPLPHKKWVVTKGYYVMFRAALSLLASKGWTSRRDHEPVPIALKVLFSEEEQPVAKEVAKMADRLESARKMRQTSSYDMYPSREEIDRASREIPQMARKFVEEAEEILRRCRM